jgi:hypothetical protein
VTEQLYEVALAREEIDEILFRCGTEALLVGGQALALWAEYFRVEPVGQLSGKVTLDVDFIGTRQVAEKLRAALGWHIYFPTIEDATPQTAKVSTTLPGGGVKQVDFLNAITGLNTANVQSRAAELELRSGTRIRILHPLDVLESRLRNLDILPAKRNPIGIAQAELAITVAGKFFNLLLESGEQMRTILDAVKRISQIALDLRLSKVAFDYDLNPLASVPWLRIDSAAFQSKRWPQILGRAEDLKRKHAERAARQLARRLRK